MIRTIDDLQSRGLIAGTIGEVPPPNARLAFNVWARKEPKRPFLAFTALARVLSGQPMTVYVDDALSVAVTGRTWDEQAALNERYRLFFIQEGCDVQFSSDIYAATPGEGPLGSILEIGNRMSVNEFLRCLPRERRADPSQSDLTECLHALMELTLMGHIGAEREALLIGNFSQAILASHRNLSRYPLTGIVVPRLATEEAVDGYIRSLTLT